MILLARCARYQQTLWCSVSHSFSGPLLRVLAMVASCLYGPLITRMSSFLHYAIYTQYINFLLCFTNYQYIPKQVTSFNTYSYSTFDEHSLLVHTTSYSQRVTIWGPGISAWLTAGAAATLRSEDHFGYIATCRTWCLVKQTTRLPSR